MNLLNPTRATLEAHTVGRFYNCNSERLLCVPLRLLCALCGYQSFSNRRERKERAKRRKELNFAAVVLLVLLFVTLAQGQVTSPSPKPTPAPVVMGDIRGRVVTSDGRPLTNASVMAQGVSATPSIKVKTADAEGAFLMEDLPSGLYIVTALAPGYIDEAMTIGDPTELPRHLIGSRLKITMIKGGVVTGVVTDSKGQPVVGVPVTASAPSGASTLSSFMVGTFGETDDRGIYRIYGLAPGPYIVAAGGGSPFGQFSTTGFELDAPTFYPSSTRDTAVPVAVRSGDEAAGIDIRYRGAEGRMISGVVLGSVESGAPGGAVFVMLSPAGTSAIQSMAMITAVEQRRVFSFNGVADGDYDLFAGYQGGPNENQMIASKRVSVRNGDVTGVELKLAMPGAIAGTIVLDPIKEEDKCDKRSSQIIEIALRAPRDDGKKSGGGLMPALFGNIGALLNAKGEFNIKNVATGKYRFEIKLPTNAWYVRAISPGPASPAMTKTTERPANPGPGTPTLIAKSTPSTAVAKSPSELSEGLVIMKAAERISGITISVGQDAAGLSGKVAGTNEGAAVPGGLRVHLVPAEREQANNVLRYSEVIVNSDATFGLTNLAPGRYLIVSRIKEDSAAGVRPRDLAWDAAARAKLRTAAEAANIVVELKPCEHLRDYSLKLQPVP